MTRLPALALLALPALSAPAHAVTKVDVGLIAYKFAVSYNLPRL